MEETVLEFQHIGKQFFGVPVLKEIDFTLKKGRILGLAGENGAGKSTLMNILGGVFPPGEGSLRLFGKPYAPKNPSDALSRGIAFIHQELNLFSNLSIAENIFIHNFPKKSFWGIPCIDKTRLYEKTQLLLDAVQLDRHPGTLAEDLSTGERQLTEIAKALSIDAGLILFDEPTTSLSGQEIKRLFDLIHRLRSQGISMIYISHALDDIQSLCDDIAVLRDGEIAAIGPKSDFNTRTIISNMTGREIEAVFPKRAPALTGDILFRAESITQPGIVRDISFTLHRGEILGIAGLMGSGRTELARILFGLDRHASGQIHLEETNLTSFNTRQRIQHGLSFLTEDRRQEGLLMDASLSDNIALASLSEYTQAPLGFLSENALRQDAASESQAVHLRCQSLQQSVKTLSGGNQQKTVLAKWLLRKPSVLILDEPTRGIDVGAKYEIYKTMNGITASGSAILFISSEIEELTGMCDRILVMRKGEIHGSFERAEFNRERILRSALGED